MALTALTGPEGSNERRGRKRESSVLSLPEIHGKFDGTQNALNGPEGDEKGGGKGEALNRVARSGT